MAYSSDETAEYDGAHCVAETDKAIRVNFQGAFAWIPKSQVHDDSEVYADGDTGKLIVKLWFAEKEGLFE